LSETVSETIATWHKGQVGGGWRTGTLLSIDPG
jgi:hypothetical protein